MQGIHALSHPCRVFVYLVTDANSKPCVQVFAAGDLSDPHGTHRTCLAALLQALQNIMADESQAAWMKDCYVWLYRGAWQVGAVVHDGFMGVQHIGGHSLQLSEELACASLQMLHQLMCSDRKLAKRLAAAYLLIVACLNLLCDWYQ